MKIENEFVPYEQALALKELGFNEPCFGYYLDNEFQFFADVRSCNTNSEFGFYPTAPTYSQAFRFFREKYDLFISIMHYENGYSINDLRRFDSYEEAELACLIKLIEIVKK
jgi:hypothetical protein